MFRYSRECVEWGMRNEWQSCFQKQQERAQLATVMIFHNNSPQFWEDTGSSSKEKLKDVRTALLRAVVATGSQESSLADQNKVVNKSH